MTPEQITEINSAVGAQGAGLICKFFTDAVENKTLHPTLIEGRTWAAVSDDTIFVKTGLWGFWLARAIAALRDSGVIETKENGIKCSYYFFSADRLKSVLAEYRERVEVVAA